MLTILMIFSKHTVSVVAFIVVTLYFLDTVARHTHHKVEAAAQDASIAAEEATRRFAK